MTEVVRLRHVADVNPPSPRFDRLRSDAELTFLPMEAVWPGERIDRGRVRLKSSVETGFTRFQDGDVLLPKITPTFEAARSVLVNGLVNGTGAGTTELHVLRPQGECDGRYLTYVTHSHPFLKIGESQMYGVAGQKRVPDGFVRDFPVHMPSPDEQRRIADFLDVETARSDHLASARTGSLALMEEHVASVVEGLVCGMGRSDLTRSTYPPLGLVPRNWRQGRLRSVRCEIQTGPFGSQLHADDYVDDGWPVVNPANITLAGITPTPGVTVGEATRRRLARHVLRGGDVVFGRRGELGRAALVREAEEGWLCGTGSLRVRLIDKGIAPEYLARYLRISTTRYYLGVESVGSTMANLNTSILLSMPLLIPPIAEQLVIIRKCRQLEAEFHSVADTMTRQIDLLGERRGGLITAAVTGQIDVTTARGAEV